MTRLPSGWVAAPLEPTEAMLNAACESGPDTNNGQFSWGDAQEVWAAMLQAAPFQPKMNSPGAIPMPSDTSRFGRWILRIWYALRGETRQCWCGAVYHKSWGSLCPDCSGAD